jgi:hypothetical protein
MQTIPKLPNLEWKLSNGIVSNQLIRKWEFNIQIIKWLDGQKNNAFDMMLLYPVESGNYIRLMKKGRKVRDDYQIELKNIVNTKIVE